VPTAEDRSEARFIGDLPRLNIETYLNIAMEPHNAMVQVNHHKIQFFIIIFLQQYFNA
jgi:hypothetical protein